MFYDYSVTKIQEKGRTVSLVSLAVPKFVEQISLIMLNTVNTLMLTRYSQDAVAAVNVASQLENMMVIVINIIITGMAIVMSIELGRNDHKSAGQVAGTAVISVFAVALILGLVVSFLSDELVGLMNLTGNAKELSVDYFKIRSSFIFITMLMSIFNNMLICNGYSAEALFVCMLSNILNVVFGYIVLYSGIDVPLGGIKGLSAAGIVAQLVALLCGIAIYMKNKCPFVFVFKKSHFKRIMRVGVPAGIGMISYVVTQIITTGFIASMGVLVLNTKVYIDNIINYTSKIGWAIATSNGILVGRYRGRNEFDKINILYRQNMIITVLSNTILSVIAFIFSKQLISIFSYDSTVLQTARVVMGIDIAVEIARAVNNMAEQSLNANGDVKIPLVVSVVTCWIFGVFLTYILGIKCGLGLVGCWIGFAIYEAVKATLFSIRWHSRRWKEIDV